MGFFAFTLSLLLLVLTSRRMALRWSGDAADRSWVLLAAAVGQVGVISLGLSLFRQFAPTPFLLAQCAMLTGVMLLTPRKRLVLPVGKPALMRMADSLGAITRSPAACIIALLLLAFIGTTLIEQLMMPVFDFDDRMYHASRAAYWMQHQSILDFPTHNDRQIAFPLTGELMFAWPLMMTRSEPTARLIFWLAYPLTAMGIYLSLRSLRSLRTSARAASLGALLFCATPIVLYHTQTVHPDLWLALFCVGVAHFAGRLRSSPLKGERLGEGFSQDAANISSNAPTPNPSSRPSPLLGERGKCLLIGVFAAFALGTRAIALPLVVMVPITALLVARLRLRGAGWSIAGLILGLLLSGSLGVFVQNAMRDDTALGSSPMRDLHAADVGARQLYVHTVRAILTLADVPFAPTGGLRQTIDDIKNNIAITIGAGESLQLERPGEWPGPQRFETRARSAGLSIAGWFALPALFYVLKRALVRREIDRLAAIALLALPFWGATILLIRWMDGMPRFWVGPYAMALLVLVPMVAAWARRAWVRLIAVLLLAAMMIPSLYDRWLVFRTSMPDRQPPAWVFDDLREPLAHIPDGSRILLIANADVRDYALFRPERGFVNEVVPWGKSTFDADRLGVMLSRDITHVLIQNDDVVNLYWDGMLQTEPFVRGMERQDGWVEIPLKTPGMRLFSRRLDRF